MPDRTPMLYTALVFLFLAGALFVLAVHGQDKPKPAPAAAETYEPAPDELQRLQVIEWAAAQAQAAVTQANANLQKIASSFNSETEAIKKAHGWPDTIQLDAAALRKGEIKFVPASPVPVPLDKPTGPPAEPAAKKP
jgi:hypothetical protein